MLRILIYLVFSTLIFSEGFKFGVDNFMDSGWEKYKGKNIALISNQTGVDTNLNSTIDLLNDNLNLIRIFSPEHGINGVVPAGENVSSGNKKQVELVSLYGKNKRMLPKMLNNVDVLIYDIQDIGCRSYTYISTLKYSMIAAEKAGVEFIVLDRPVPYSGDIVDGNIIEDGFFSFIGSLNIPYIYGMTTGELSLFIKEEYKLKKLKLDVVKMEGYDRNLSYRNLNVAWIQPSPHIPTPETSLFYTITGTMGELDSIWEGVGWTTPFQAVGAPWINGNLLAKELNGKIEGIRFIPFSCTPYYGDFKGKRVSGVQFYLDKNFSRPFYTSLVIISTLKNLYPDINFLSKDEGKMFEKATGTDEIKKMLASGKDADYIYNWYKKDLELWNKKRAKFLLY